MKISTILKKAAMAITNGQCKSILSAIMMVNLRDHKYHAGSYHHSALCHQAYQLVKNLYDIPGQNSFGPVTDESTEHRILALLFASHIAKDKERKNHGRSIQLF